MSKAGFLHAPGAPLPTWWTTFPVRAAVLTAWAGGKAAAALQRRGRDAIEGCAVDTLAALLRVERRSVERELEGIYLHEWHADPYSRGAYSYIRSGGMAAAQRLCRPIEDTLFLAGEHTAPPSDRGTVHGAMVSGERAARQLAGILRPAISRHRAKPTRPGERKAGKAARR
jgi:monoamine oxidase